MQEPSPGTTKEITDINRGVSSYPESNINMIGQCVDAADVAMSGGGTSTPNIVSATVTALMDPQTQAQFEADKRAVYKHPLFPLLALLFEKCELATQSAEVPSSESFNMDIQAFVQHQERDRKPFFSDDPDVDGLMVKAIQVLRIHLLELEKVQELCKDFCSRYIACLKNKMQSENLLRPDYPGLNNNIPSSGSSTPSSGSQSQPLPNVSSNGALTNFVLQSGVTQNSISVNSLNQNPLVSGGTMYQMVQTPQGIVAQPIQIPGSQMQSNTPNSHVIHGSTPLSQIGATSSASQEARLHPITPRSSIHSGDEDDDILCKKKQKRGVLPKHATSIMRSWLFQHIVHPYPTEDEKKQIASQTNLTLLQVNNWFINARRRILQPMLDASNPDNNHKAKKSKTQSNRPVQRFWPENIASIQPQLQDHSQNSVHNSAGSQEQTTGSAEIKAGTSARNCSPLGAVHSSPEGNHSQNCTDNDEGKALSMGSLDDLSMSSDASTEEEKDN